MYKEASRLKLRFKTDKGVLTTEQLWDISLEDLDKLVLSLEEDIEKEGKKSYLKKRTVTNKIAKLKFDTALDVLTTLVEEAESAKNELEKKKSNQKIEELIAEKEAEELKGKSVEELRSMLR